MDLDLGVGPPGSSVASVDLPPGSRLVVMTYDDGPEPGGTDKVLLALDEYEARATFFVLLTRAHRERHFVSEIHACGHELALHGQDHRRLSRLDERAATAQLCTARARLEDIVGHEIRWFRPPYGDQSVESWSATVAAGLIPVMWTVEARDWADIPEAQRVANACGVREPGGIVLCHDGFPDARDGVASATPPTPFDRGRLARAILDNYRARGLTACSLGRAASLGQLHTRVWLNGHQRGRGEA